MVDVLEPLSPRCRRPPSGSPRVQASRLTSFVAPLRVDVGPTPFLGLRFGLTLRTMRTCAGLFPGQTPKIFAELHGHRHVELLVGARRGSRAASAEAAGVAEPVALHVLVRDLGDELDAQRLPAQVLVRRSSGSAPPGRPLAPRPRSADASAQSRHGWSSSASFGRARPRRAARPARRHAAGDARRGAAHRRRRRGRAAASRRRRRPCADGSRRPRSRRCAGASPSAWCACPRRTGRRGAWPPRRRTPAPSKRSNQFARRRRGDRGVRCIGGSAFFSASPRARAVARERSAAEVLVAVGEQVERDERRGGLLGQHRHRDCGGWIRSDSGSKSRPRSVAITISPSTTHRSGSDARSGARGLGK